MARKKAKPTEKPDALIAAAMASSRERRLYATERKLKAKAFAAAYVKTNDVKQAATVAAVSPKMADELIETPSVRRDINEGISAAAKAAGISREWVLRSLKSVAERCMTAEPVLDKQGEPTGEYKFDASGANRSLELLGKHLKLFEDDLSAASQIGNAVLRSLAQEAQDERFKPVATTAEPTPTSAIEKGPISQEGDLLAPGQALPGARDEYTVSVAPDVEL